MPRPSNTQERQTQITRALIAVMAREGYDGASVNAIAKEAGLSSGLLHYHFKKKEDILLALLEELTRRHLEHLAHQMTPLHSVWARLDAFIDAHLGLGAEADPEALACWIVLSGEVLRRPHIREAYTQSIQQIIGVLEAVLEEGQGASEFSIERPEAAAAALVATIQGYYVLAAAARQLIPRGSAAAATRAMARGLLK